MMSNFSSYPQYFVTCFLDFYIKTGTRFSLQDKRLFEITEFEITRVDCIIKQIVSSSYLTDKRNVYTSTNVFSGSISTCDVSYCNVSDKFGDFLLRLCRTNCGGFPVWGI